ncbi:MAG: hypothetical protein EAZ77_02075 [Nostocales cyanobacterium]|nr:MAG: hypothetical protein EAZ77_02075 [Nostocales cyanobacterium]
MAAAKFGLIKIFLKKYPVFAVPSWLKNGINKFCCFFISLHQFITNGGYWSDEIELEFIANMLQ